MKYHKGIDWDNQSLLGKISDSELARQLNINSSTVRTARINREIKRFCPFEEPKDINWDSQPFGEISDIDLANILNVDVRLVVRERTKRKIKRFKQRKTDRINEIDWLNVGLGEKIDREVGKELGFSEVCITIIRNKLGIKSCEEKRFENMKNNECWCFSCKQILIKDDFTNREFRRSGNTGQCRNCTKLKHKNKRKNNKEYDIKCRLRKRLQRSYSSYLKNGNCVFSKKYKIDFKEIFLFLENIPHCKNDHLDHIVPLSFFNFNDEEQIRLAFSPKNHCWINESENHKKSDQLLYFEGKLGRHYKNISLCDKIHIYEEILEKYWKEYINK